MHATTTGHNSSNATTYFAVVHTQHHATQCANLMHNAAQPWAVVSYNGLSTAIVNVYSRHATKRGAAAACTKRNKRWQGYFAQPKQWQ